MVLVSELFDKVRQGDLRFAVMLPPGMLPLVNLTRTGVRIGAAH